MTLDVSIIVLVPRANDEVRARVAVEFTTNKD